MHYNLKTWQEKRQEASQSFIAGLLVSIIGLIVFITPIVLLANQL